MYTKYPGKLFLMGEFAIMEKGSVSVVSAVNHFLNVTIEASDTFAINSSHGRLKGEAVFENKIMPHVHESLKVLNDLIAFEPFTMTIESELEIDKKKVGFGSSGVVIVGVLDSVLRFHGTKINKIDLFKLACLVQLKMQEFSSGGDLAACVYGGTVMYQRYDVDWLLEQDFNVKALLQMDWPDLKIEPLNTKPVFNVEIGWTGEPHSTNASLQVLNQKVSEDPKYYEQWLLDANECTRSFINAVHVLDFESVNEAVREYRQLMLTLESWLEIKIETDELIDLIESTQYPAKVSGSGGGDCGIVFVPLNQPLDFLDLWKEKSIMYIEGGIQNEY